MCNLITSVAFTAWILGRSFKEHEMGGTCNTHGRDENCMPYVILVRKLQGARAVERHLRGWEDNIKIYMEERGCGDVDCVDLTQNRD
jgi:hypothetical protein